MSDGKIVTPTIHLNGSSGEVLRDQYRDAHRAIVKALDVLSEVGLNARDYYPQGATAYFEARRQHENWLIDLYKIEKDLDGIVDSIQNQIDARRK